TVSYSVGVDLLDVCCGLAGEICTGVEEWIVCRSRTVIIKTEHNTSKVRIVRIRPTKLIVRNWSIGRILKQTTTPVIAHDQIDFSIEAKANYATIMVSSQWL